MAEEKQGIILPTVKTPARATNLKNLLIYGKEKSGKTTAVNQLPNNLILDVENGTAFINGLIMQPPENYGPVQVFRWLKEVAKKIRDDGYPYDYVTIDTLSQLDIFAENVGTYNYMHSIAGKEFNRQKDENGKIIYVKETGKSIMLRPSDPNYESVLTLPYGYGFRHTRDAILDIFETLKNLGKICTIFVCHVADKYMGEKDKAVIYTKDLALVGKGRDIIPRLVDGTANVWNDEGQFMISFKGNDQQIGGVRAPHLTGYVGKLDWGFIFKKEEIK